jgi:glycosyltransferase involved in cell wall biosynthesis
MAKVLIIQGQIKTYRVPFFIRLQEALQVDGIDLKVAYSPPSESEFIKRDNADLPNAFSTKVPGSWAVSERILYQPLLHEIAASGLVIVEHANKHFLNHLLLLLRLLRIKRFAFWGLGANKQSDRSRFSEWYKRLTLRQADWYFAYTRSVAEEVITYGVPAERITAVQNAVDTRELQTQIASISNEELESARKELGIEAEHRVGIFCGMLDPVKSVPFLIECAEQVKHQVPGFHLLLVGGGRDQDQVSTLIQDMPWVHMLGPKFGREKALMFKLSDVFLLPGRVGLTILDCFAARLPLLTVRIPIHGPEIEYLDEGVNGFMVKRDPSIYADTAARVLRDPGLLWQLREGAAISARKYSIEVMVENFRIGIIRCLQSRCAGGAA